MLSLDQIQRELKAIAEFDMLFLAQTERGKEETLEDATLYHPPGPQAGIALVSGKPRGNEVTPYETRIEANTGRVKTRSLRKRKASIIAVLAH
jgi:hypothetical protein